MKMDFESDVPYCFICGKIRIGLVDISYHSFPRNIEKLRNWLQPFGITLESVQSKIENACLCSRHFQPTDFTEGVSGEKRKLSEDAIPSIKFIDGNENVGKGLRVSNSDSEDNHVPLEHDYTKADRRIKYWKQSKTCIICRRQCKLDLSFFMFPKGERRKQWLEACNLQRIPFNARLCSRHFESKCFSRPPDSSFRCTLKKNAVPTLFLSGVHKNVDEIPNTQNNRDEFILPDNVHQYNQQTIKIEPKEEYPQPETNRDPLELPKKEFTENAFLHHEPTPDSTNNEYLPQYCKTELDDSRDSSASVSAGSEGLTFDTSDEEIDYAQLLVFPKIRNMQSPRYPGEIKPEHLSTPEGAKKCVDMVMKKIRGQRKHIKTLQQRIRRDQKQLAKLKQIVMNLKMKKLCECKSR